MRQLLPQAVAGGSVSLRRPAVDIGEKARHYPAAGIQPEEGPPQGLTPCEMRSMEMMCSWIVELDESLVAMLAFALAASREGALVLPKTGEGCVYHEGSGCSIYDTRPEVCAMFPDLRLFEGFAALLQ